MQQLKSGDYVGVRGPFGTHWPLSRKNCDVLVIAGGLGLAPLRPALLALAADRHQYKKVTLLYGARTPEDVLYKNEILEKLQIDGLFMQINLGQIQNKLYSYQNFKQYQ